MFTRTNVVEIASLNKLRKEQGIKFRVIHNSVRDLNYNLHINPGEA
jgi:hypothetical protein